MLAMEGIMILTTRIMLAAAMVCGAGAAFAQAPNPNPMPPSAAPPEAGRSVAPMPGGQPGPIVNGQRRQPTAREVGERRSTLPEAQHPDVQREEARRDAELEDIFRSLNEQIRR
jgi:hypothetical protein